MMRPMPGPPQWLESAGLGDWDADGRWRNRWDLHWEDGRTEFDVLERHDKRLTDVECAAHRWQAASTLGLALYAPAEVLGVDIPEDGNMYSWERPDAEPLNRAYDAWHRFAIYPHALEES